MVKLPSAQDDLPREFARRRAAGVAETHFMSSVEQMNATDSHMRLVAMGKDILPLIFEDLRKTGRPWYGIIRDITGDKPEIPKEYWGKMPIIQGFYLEWARERGWV